MPAVSARSASLPAQVATPLVDLGGGRLAEIWDREVIDEFEEIARRRLSVVQLYRGAFDAAPLSLITLQSVRSVAAGLDVDLELERFRPNLVVDAIGERPYPEDKWVSRVIGFGDAKDAPRLRIIRRDPRCAVVNLHPVSASADPRVLRHIVEFRRNQLGVYAFVERPGEVQVGALVWLA